MSSRYLAIVVLVIAVVSVAMGATFIYQAIDKENLMRGMMRAEKVTYGLPEERVKQGDVIDTPAEAQAVADIVREHRHSIAPTYQELLGAGKYDPTNPKHLTYTQALNLENYLYLGVLGFGVTTAITATGAFMILAGIGFAAIGVVLLGLTRRVSQAG